MPLLCSCKLMVGLLTFKHIKLRGRIEQHLVVGEVLGVLARDAGDNGVLAYNPHAGRLLTSTCWAEWRGAHTT